MPRLASLLFWLGACAPDPADTPVEPLQAPSPAVEQARPAAARPAPAPRSTPGPRAGVGPPPGGGAPGSGAALQDPFGFPIFHNWPAPAGPPPASAGSWASAVRLSEDTGGGYRPQVVAAPDGTLHAVFYARLEPGDLIRHRTSADGRVWTKPVHVGWKDQRNWGPDLVARADGSVVLVFDHAQPDFTSRGYVTTWSEGVWSEPLALTPDDPEGEVGSGHVADALDDDLVYVWIGKKMDPQHRFVARARVRTEGTWGPAVALTDGTEDAWHTNAERRPDGSILAGWDVGTGGGETRLFVAEARDGRFSTPEDLSVPPGQPGERIHFAFGPDGTDHLTWFHKVAGRPLGVSVRSGRPGAWSSAVDSPSAGVGGFHFDPDIAVNAAGVRVLVWGWDAGADAELLYSVDRGEGWSRPAKVADLDWGKPGLPSIAVDPKGRFHVVWNQGVRGENHVYAATLEVRP